MKLTKVLKEYVEEQMNSARYKANKEASADYEKRRADVEAEIKKYLAEVVNPHIEEILKANGMDLEIISWGHLEPASEKILQFFPQNITNKEEREALNEAERKRRTQQEESIKRFALECELGIDKDSFYEAVAKLVAEVK